jgi:hypothetical protein
VFVILRSLPAAPLIVKLGGADVVEHVGITSEVALDVADTVPPEFVTVIITLINLEASLEVKT